jgi:hypothetical protein
LRSNPTDLAFQAQYKKCTGQWRQLICSYELDREMHIIESNNVGTFYRYVNKRIAYRPSIGVLTDSTGKFVVSDIEKANVLNEYFASVGTVGNNITPVCPVDVGPDKTLDTVEFNVVNVMFSINKLKPNLSSGHDSFPPLMFKRLKHCLAEPLATIFTQLLSVAFVPEEWKKAIITPVFKKGAPGTASNYRPISLTCVPCKIMERVIVQQMYRHFSDNRILHHAQHGFVKGRSTCTNLLECLNDWTLSLQYRRGVTVAYIDFSKAFDTVSHEKLFIRLKSYGITGSLLNWLRNLLTGRTHQTKVGIAMSDTAKLLSGVIQGSGIGPLFFLCYINELVVLLEKYGVCVKMFADDAKMYAEIVNVCDHNKLQLALDKLVDWSELWQLTVSIDKCCILNIGSIPSCIPDPPNYCINGCVLPVVSSCRDLGVTMSCDLSPREHINAIVLKAQQRANIILRCFVSRDATVLLRAFIVYVRPLVEYNCVVWSPYLKQDIERIERVQRRFTKRMPGLKNYAYADRLEL